VTPTNITAEGVSVDLDAKLHRIYEGSSQIQRVVLGRGLLT
jgi:alkylation response protein AidB-like acyl-CoA dehydrogenase